MRSKEKVVTGLLVITILSGCINSELDIPQSGDKIQFRTVIFDTKASSYVPDGKGSNIITSMGIYAASTGTQAYDPGSHSANFLTNVKVSRIDASSEWSCDNPQYWPLGNNTFFAYSPYEINNKAITIPPNGVPKIKFTVQKDQKEQVDLMIAKPALNHTKTENAVTMQMQHALTRISFSAKVSHDLSTIKEINSVKVSKIEINGVYSSGTHRLDADDDWTDLSTVVPINAPYHLDNGTEEGSNGGLKSDIELTHTEFQNITADNGYLLMMPQSLSAEKDGSFAKLKVWISTDYKNSDGSEAIFTDPIEFSLDATALDWKQGEAIKYMINIDLRDLTTKKGTLTAKVVEWQPISFDSEILQRELNVTRLSAKVWGTGRTRIHFWSNQPYVWIENSEIYGSASSIDFENPISQKKVNDYFSEIGHQFNIDEINSGSDKKTVIDEQYATYNNKKNFYYDSSTGKGYFDVETLENPENPKDWNYGIIICATNEKYIDMPLRRSILLN